MSQPEADFIAFQAALSGEYSLDREIGRGGMGIVYLAREVRLARPVAIKVLPPALAARADLREAFLRESQTVARLTHPNIVPVYTAGERAGFVYIVMAYVEGITLGERIRTRGPLLPGQAARVLREVSWALAYAHAAGIVHRDVSAENILLERGSERAIVMDFGIASAMRSAAISDDGRVMGNAHYVSPEQAVGEPVDARSDLYSLGVCGFYALTGRLPFDAQTPAEVVTLHLTKPAPAISAVASAVPARLGQAVDRCLAKEPLRRYRNAESFAEAIDLAFEHAKEIPTPLRVWITQGQRDVAARLALVVLGGGVGLELVKRSLNPWWFFLPVGIATGVSFIPAFLRLRRLLREGYYVDDLHAALRENALVQSEEMEYERSLTSPMGRKVAWAAFGVSVFSGMTFARLFAGLSGFQPQLETDYAIGILASLSTLAGASIALAGDFVRFRLSARVAELKVSFWKSTWAQRIAKIAGFGLKPAERPLLGMPLLTEVALGRATDHLFQALPKASRRELAGLPVIVRLLESDASKLRASIEAFDDQLAVFERGESRSAGMLQVSRDVEAVRAARRDAIESELRDARAHATARLAATVAALENIRLDLLRLQMGSAGIESVTASLEAAQRVGEQIDMAVEAQGDVERMLRESLPSEYLLDELLSAEDDDADTPVGGVPATRG